MKSILIASSILIALIAALRPLLRGRIDRGMTIEIEKEIE